MSYILTEPNVQQSVCYIAHQLRDSLGAPDCVQEQRATFAAVQYALLRFGPLPVHATDAVLVERTICTHPNIVLVPANLAGDAKLSVQDRSVAEDYIAETDCSSAAYRRAWNIITEFIRSSKMKVSDQQFLDMLMFAISSGMNIMRYVLPRSGNTTLCEHLHSMFPMRHIAVYSPHYDMNDRWKTYSNDKRIERELYGTLRHSFSFGGHERRSRTTCALHSSLRSMDNRYPDFSDSLVVVFDGAQSSAAAIEDFARTFISQNVQTVMLVSPSDRDIQMTQILTATGRQSWLINSD